MKPYRSIGCLSGDGPSSYQAGVTIIELLIALAIMGILAGLAVGSRSLFSNIATVTEINDLIGDLYYSRTEALKRRTTITLCQSSDQERCTKGADWESGWIVFTDLNRNREVDEDDGDQVLLIRDGLRGNGALSLGSGYYYYIMFAPTGEAYPRNTFKYCRDDYPPRAIILFATGRARISSLDSSGKPLECG